MNCHDELLFFEDETGTRLLERLPVVRQSEHFPQAMLWYNLALTKQYVFNNCLKC